jgi:hypothetical protein
MPIPAENRQGVSGPVDNARSHGLLDRGPTAPDGLQLEPFRIRYWRRQCLAKALHQCLIPVYRRLGWVNV